MVDPFKSGTADSRDTPASLVAAEIDSFASCIAQLGYAPSTIPARVRLVTDFSRWLEQRGMVVADVRTTSLADFLRQRRRRGARRRGEIATLERFLNHLEADGVIPAAPAPTGNPSPRDEVGRRYQEYLRTERGLAPSTLKRYWHIVREFLDRRFGDGLLRLSDVTPDDITRFLLRQPAPRSEKSAQLEVTVLRSFFRFLIQEREIGRDLAAAVPTVRRWRLADVPKYLVSGDVARVVASCDRRSAVGQRDYAILLLLARLGLRAGEVVRLELGDLDWRAGELTVRGKGSVHARLPLPADVGDALATYLRTARPSGATRRVFVRTRAPQGSLTHASTVSAIVRRAINRTGLMPPTTGAHLLRHSLATDLLRRGASLVEIGELLRHQSPQTTEIYAKVDLAGLRGLARPWPVDGGAP